MRLFFGVLGYVLFLCFYFFVCLFYFWLLVGLSVILVGSAAAAFVALGGREFGACDRGAK